MAFAFLSPTARATWAGGTSQPGQLTALAALWAGQVAVRYYTSGGTHLATVTHEAWVIDTETTPRSLKLGAWAAESHFSGGTAAYCVCAVPSGDDILRADVALAGAISDPGGRVRLDIGTTLRIDANGALSTLPDWLVDKPLNEWFTLPDSVLYGLATDAGSVTESIYADYSGVVVQGAKVRAFGGGHGASNDNTLALFDMDAATGWVVECQPTPTANRVLCTNAVAVAIEQLWWGTSPNLKPNPPHTYSSGQWIPSLGRIIWFGQRGPWSFSGNLPTGFNRLLQWDPDAAAWVQPGSADDVVDPSFGRDTVQLPSGKVYGGGGTTIYEFDPSQPVGSQFSLWLTNATLNWSAYGAYMYDALRDRIVRVGDLGSSKYITIDVSTKAVTNVASLLNGDAGDLSALNARVAVDTCGACIDPINDRIIVPTGIAGGSFFAIDLDTWAVTLESPAVVSGHTISGTPLVSGNPAGLYGRIHYIPEYQGVMYAPKASGSIAFLRLA